MPPRTQASDRYWRLVDEPSWRSSLSSSAVPSSVKRTAGTVVVTGIVATRPMTSADFVTGRKILRSLPIQNPAPAAANATTAAVAIPVREGAGSAVFFAAAVGFFTAD